MQTLNTGRSESQPRLRAMVEVIDGDLKIMPIADSEEQAKQIMDSIFAWKNDA